MPAKSAAQQKAAGAALAAKRGEISPSELKGASKEMYSSMSERQLRSSHLRNVRESLSMSLTRARHPQNRARSHRHPADRPHPALITGRWS